MTFAAENKNRTNIIRGEFIVTDNPKLCVTTLLGSCVAACIRDPLAGVGGLNHFLLPGADEGGSTGADVRMGVHLMELLVNGLLKAGARRDRLEAKLFGGARAVKGLSDIGELNTQFAERFLRREGIVFVAGSTGGDSSRRIEYWPVSGRARQVLLSSQEIIPTPPPKIQLPMASNAGELELF